MKERLLEIFEYEIDALVNLVTSSTSDYYIKNYARLLSNCKVPEDMSKIQKLSTNLISWYSDNFHGFKKNEYMYSIDQHKKTYMLLEEIKSLTEEV